MNAVVTGSIVRFKSLEDCKKAMNRRGGWNEDMTEIVEAQGSEPFKIQNVLGSCCKFKIADKWTWHIECFEVVDGETAGYRMFISGDVVFRSTRFTETFVEGESHVVDRISACGYYMHVKGHRHKVPMRYFQLATRFREGDRVSFVGHAFVWTVNDVRDNGTQFRKAENLAQGYTSTAGYEVVAHAPELTTFEKSPEPEIEPTIEPTTKPFGDSYEVIVQAIKTGSAIQYWFSDEWVDVCKNKLTVGQLARIPVRVKPTTVDYYGVELEQPLDVDTWTHTPVYGVSFHKGEVFPCSLGVARKNQMSGSGKYWATEEQANLVRNTILKPFGATK